MAILRESDIASIIRQWKDESATPGVIQFDFDSDTGVLEIYTSAPGYLKGNMDETLNKYLDIFGARSDEFKDIEFVETASRWL